MNTYTFSLQQGSLTKESIIRAENLDVAKRNVDENWSIVSVQENGEPIELN